MGGIIALRDLRVLFENEGVDIREQVYAQLAHFLDTDRNDTVGVAGLVNYLKNGQMKAFRLN